MQKNTYELKTLVIMALLAALGAVFSAFLSIEIPFSGIKAVEISLTPIPIMLAGIFFGPLAGGIVGFVADTSGFFMGVQHGAYNPIFSITMALFGVIAGLFYLKSKKSNIWKITGVAALSQVVCSVVLNTMIIWLWYQVPIMVLLPTRALAALIELPFYAWLLMTLVESLRPMINKRKKIAGRA